MSKTVVRIILKMIRVSALALLIPNMLWAADEDMYASVYLTFDPVTGTFISTMATDQTQGQSQDPSAGTTARQHTIAQADTSSETTATSAVVTLQNNGQSNRAQDVTGIGTSTILIGGIVVLALVLGAVLMRRKNQQKLTA